MFRVIFRIAFISLICLSQVNAQTKFTYAPVPAAPSPNAQNLGLYGEMPVSLFTGIPQISVPIYELNLKGVTLPISASYHASGTKVDQHPSWIGMGWNLFAGGSVDRVQRGIPDEKNYDEPSTVGGILRGYYGTHYLINRQDWARDFLATNINFDGTEGLVKDLEPDEFRFSYPGNSGSFFLNEKGKWCVQSEKPVKVVFDESTDIGTNPMGGTNYEHAWEDVFKRFTLLDGFGYKYVFGGVEDAIEYSDTYYSVGKLANHFSATSWKLTKIIAPTGEELFDLAYERGPTVAQLYISALQKGYFASYNGGALWAECGGGVKSWANSIGHPERGNLISPVYLKYIKCVQKDVRLNFITEASNEMSYLDPNAGNLSYAANNPYLSAYVGTYMDERGGTSPGFENNTPGDFVQYHFLRDKVPFFKGSPNQVYWKNIIWLKLARIEITDAGGNAIERTVRFDYDNGLDERLRLWQVAFLGSSGSSDHKYEFKYNEEPVARYLRSVGDHWGFYNSDTYLPDILKINKLSKIESYKQPSLEHTQAGILTEIIYPTGGSTKFEYELNNCSKVVSINTVMKPDGLNEVTLGLEDYAQTVGGLRVKRIITDDAASGTTIKEYYYVKGYTVDADANTLASSGILQAKPKYSSAATSSSSEISFDYQAYYTHPVIPLTEFGSGTHVGYSEVVEKRSDGSYTIHKYTNHDNGYEDEIFIASYNGSFNYQFPVSSRAHERGKLLEQAMYDYAGVPVSHIINTYARDNSNYARAVRNGKEFFCEVPNIGVSNQRVSFDHFHKTAYKIFYNSLRLKSSLEKTYSQKDVGKFVDAFREFQYNSNGDIAEEVLIGSAGEKIKKNYVYPGSFADIEPYKTMEDRHMVSPLVEELLYENDKLLQSTKTNYGFWGEGSWSVDATDIVVPRLVETKTTNQVNHEPRLRYHSYDGKGNVVTVSKESTTPTTYIWGYNHTLPIAKVENALHSAGSSHLQGWLQNFHFMDYMSTGTPYSFEGSYSQPQTATVTLNRTYYKGGDHETTFIINIYDNGHKMVKSFTDRMALESNALTLSSQVDLPAGTYTVEVVAHYQIPHLGTSFFQEVEASLQASSSADWVVPFHTSFEEDKQGTVNTYHKTGRRSHEGSYTIAIPPCPAGDRFLLTYWRKVTVSSDWELVSQEIVGPSAGEQRTIGLGDLYIDEVRLHSADAQMTTYTYNPLVGMTSSTDSNGRVTRYEYDGIGRLQAVKDEEGNVLKAYEYHYQGQE